MSRIGYLAEFVTGYLQREIILPKATVSEGLDESIYNSSVKGYACHRLVKVTKTAEDTYTIAAPDTGVGSLSSSTTAADKVTAVAAGIGDATHIIAQSDNSMRGTPDDYIPTEKFNGRYDGLCKNDASPKAVAVFKIINSDDIKLIDIDDVTRS